MTRRSCCCFIRVALCLQSMACWWLAGHGAAAELCAAAKGTAVCYSMLDVRLTQLLRHLLYLDSHVDLCCKRLTMSFCCCYCTAAASFILMPNNNGRLLLQVALNCGLPANSQLALYIHCCCCCCCCCRKAALHAMLNNKGDRSCK
jgi:hypothetical protein